MPLIMVLMPLSIATPQKSPQGGFSLVELLTVITILGIITTSLFYMANNVNRQIERVNNASALARQAAEMHEAVSLAAARAGFVNQGQAAITRAQAIRLIALDHIAFCGALFQGARQLTEYRVLAASESAVFQRKISNTGCLSDGAAMWQTIGEAVIDEVEFALPATAGQIVDMKLSLSKKLVSSTQTGQLSRRYLIPAHALMAAE